MQSGIQRQPTFCRAVGAVYRRHTMFCRVDRALSSPHPRFIASYGRGAWTLSLPPGKLPLSSAELSILHLEPK